MNIKNYLYTSTKNSVNVVNDHVEKYNSTLKLIKSCDIDHKINCSTITVKIRFPSDESIGERYQNIFSSKEPDLILLMNEYVPVIKRLNIENAENKSLFLANVPHSARNFPYWLENSKNQTSYDTTELYNKLINQLTIDNLADLKIIQSGLEIYQCAVSVLLDPFFVLLIGFKSFVIFGMIMHNNLIHNKIISDVITNIEKKYLNYVSKSYNLCFGFVVTSVSSFGMGILFSKIVLTSENSYKFKGSLGIIVDNITKNSVKIIYNVCNTISIFRSTALKAFLDPFVELISTYIDKISYKVKNL